MSLYDCRGRFANGKEMARRRSVSREPQAMLACDKQRTDALAACESLMPSGYRLYRGVLRQETLTQPFTKRTDKRADELISASLN